MKLIAGLLAVFSVLWPALAAAQSIGPPLTVPSVAQLQASPYEQQYPRVATQGYYTPNDNGSSDYTYSPTSTATPNGGTVLATSSGVGRWIGNGDFSSILKWGAKCDGVTDDTAALNNELSSGGSVMLPGSPNAGARTCAFNTAAYNALSWTVAGGTGYNINDFITLSNGSTVQVISSGVTAVNLVAGGSGYAAGDVLWVTCPYTVCGSPNHQPYLYNEDVFTQITVDTVSGGAISTYHVSRPGSWAVGIPSGTVVLPPSTVVFPTAEVSSSATGTGATFNMSAFGAVGWVQVTSPATTSQPANPVTQASTTGSGSGATFNTTYAVALISLNGQCIKGQAPYASNVSSTASGAILFDWVGSGNCERDLQITTPAMTDGWINLVRGGKDNLFTNIQATNIPGFIALVGSANYTSMDTVNVGGTVGGSLSLVFPLSATTAQGAKRTLFYAGGTSNYHSVAFLASKIIIGTAYNLVNALTLDGYADSPRLMTFNQNAGNSCLVEQNTVDNNTGQPQFFNAWDFDCQSPQSTTAGIDLESGAKTYIVKSFCNAALGDCVYQGANHTDLEISQMIANTAAGHIFELHGTTSKIIGGFAYNAGYTAGGGMQTCNGRNNQCDAVFAGQGSSDISVSNVTMGNTIAAGNESYGVEMAAQSRQLTLVGNHYTGELIGDWANDTGGTTGGTNGCGSTANNVAVVVVPDEGQCTVESVATGNANITYSTAQMAPLINGGHVNIWRTGTLTAAATDTTPTATAMIAALPNGGFVGAQWVVEIENNTLPNVAPTYGVTIAGGSGVTISGSAVINQGVARQMICTEKTTSTVGCAFTP